MEFEYIAKFNNGTLWIPRGAASFTSYKELVEPTDCKENTWTNNEVDTVILPGEFT